MLAPPGSLPGDFQLGMIALRPQSFSLLNFLTCNCKQHISGALTNSPSVSSWSGNNEEGRKEGRGEERLYESGQVPLLRWEYSRSVASFLCLLLFVHVKCC